jgi:hypothetical protein
MPGVSRHVGARAAGRSVPLRRIRGRPARRALGGGAMSGSGDRWQFWIDRGATFTDVVARRSAGTAATAARDASVSSRR